METIVEEQEIDEDQEEEEVEGISIETVLLNLF